MKIHIITKWSYIMFSELNLYVTCVRRNCTKPPGHDKVRK